MSGRLQPTAQPEAPSEGREVHGLGRRVLVVDDEEIVLASLRMTLRGYGFEVHTTNAPRDAVALVQALQPYAVVIDYAMGELRGDEVVRQLRALPAPLCHLRIVGLTGGVDVDGDGGALRRAGADSMLTKPVWTRDLVAALADG